MRGKVARLEAVAEVMRALEAHGVRSLIIGGIASAVYGGKSVTKDLDLQLQIERPDMERLQDALSSVQAKVIAVPTELRWEYLERGFWVHFECEHPSLHGLHLDVATRPFGAAPFDEMWSRRLSRTLPETGTQAHFVALPDLVSLKKTRRKDDWATIQLLMDLDYHGGGDAVQREQVRFWLRELRSAQTLIECVARFGGEAIKLTAERPLLGLAIQADHTGVADALDEEERLARRADEARMRPLLDELQRMRHTARRSQ